jgi:hypothetical protein
MRRPCPTGGCRVKNKLTNIYKIEKIKYLVRCRFDLRLLLTYWEEKNQI